MGQRHGVISIYQRGVFVFFNASSPFREFSNESNFSDAPGGGRRRRGGRDGDGVYSGGGFV